MLHVRFAERAAGAQPPRRRRCSRPARNAQALGAQQCPSTCRSALANLKLRETLRTQAVRDALTGLYNRRYMEHALERERPARGPQPPHRRRLHGLAGPAFPHGLSAATIAMKGFGEACSMLRVAWATFLLAAAMRADGTSPAATAASEFVVMLPEATLRHDADARGAALEGHSGG